MTPAEISAAVVAAIRSAVDADELAVVVPSTVTVERPKNKTFGDYASNIALQLAKGAGLPPRGVADVLAAHLRSSPGVASVEVAGPGFLNIRLEGAALGEIARTVVTAGTLYGHSARRTGRRVNLEFVSANPTGPVTLASTRWAAVGDALARLLTAAGHDVATEYYFNDAGVQIEWFGASVYAATRGEPPPPDGYVGAYVEDIARQVEADNPDLADLPEAKALGVCARDGVALMLAEIKRTLRDFGVDFNTWFSERTLHERGELETAVEQLRRHGHVFHEAGAVWLRTTDFGDDKDRVLVKSDGKPTYFCADAAYYLDKRQRGFDRIVILLGADHHGYIGRMRAMAACFGDDPDETLELVIGQFVNLFRAGEPVRMSKRAGTFLTLEDLVDAVGVDAARYSLVRSSIDSPLDLDLDLISRQSQDNPVYYVQYAHARIASLLRHAAELGLSRTDSFDAGLLSSEPEADLLGALGEFPRVVASAAELREPHRVARYLEALAGTYHRFYDLCRVLPLGEEPVTPVTIARLWVCEATRVVLANGLGLLGVTAPERM